MSINKYIVQLESCISSYSIISSYTLSIDRKSEDIAFISGSIDFKDGTILDFKEFIEDNSNSIEKYKYAYNYRVNLDILFRYDNAPDPRARGLRTFPNHKHLKNGGLIESEHKDLRDILEEIEETFISKEESP